MGNGLWLYAWLSRGRLLSYRAKIMLMAFIGTHVPLIAMVAYVAMQTAATWHSFFATLGVTLAATLFGTGVTLFVLSHLLRPVLMTSEALSAYRERREIRHLPTGFKDEVGTLMADADATLGHLERLLDRLEHLDEATALPNRRRLATDLAGRVAARHPFQLVAIRFTNHRQLIQALDLNAAEHAAVALATRLRDGLDGDMLYRVSECEFVALVSDEAEGTVRLTRLKRRFKALLAGAVPAINLGSISVAPQLSAGITLFPDEGADVEQLIDQAIAAAARCTSDQEVGFHSPEARSSALATLSLEQELRRALAEDEFELHYQPVVDLDSGEIRSCEALVRWRHPVRGLVSPSEFIPAAEATGLIDPLGLWVMRRACAQLTAWDAQGLTGLSVAVNLAAGQFRDPALVQHVRDALDAAGLAPERLEIELTETAAMADLDLSREVFGRLRTLGVSIAIDDFGTGYANLRHLRHLPFDKLKIDREFVTFVDSEPGAQAICEAIVALGRGFGLKLVAEGVEREAELAFLRSRGCQLFQGYYFARPMAADHFHASMANVSLAAMAARLHLGEEAGGSGLAAVG